MPPSAGGTRPVRPCPICGAPAQEAFRPFCSARCTDVDLNRWLTGVYAIPSVEDAEDANSPADDPMLDPER